MEGQGKQGFIPEQSSNNSLNSSSIPNDFKKTVRDKDGIFWQTSTVTTVENNRERTYPVLIVGTHISIAQNPNYGLFLVYDMTDSSATIAHILTLFFWWFLCTAYCGAFCGVDCDSFCGPPDYADRYYGGEAGCWRPDSACLYTVSIRRASGLFLQPDG